MRTDHENRTCSSTSLTPVWPQITPTTSALVWTSYSLNIFSQPCLPRPVYPLRVLQPAKKCNLWPKSVICEHPSGIIQSISLSEWHNENLDNCVHDTCVLNKNKFSRWRGLLSFICGTTSKLQDNIQATETVCVTQHVYTTKAIIIIMEICNTAVPQA